MSQTVSRLSHLLVHQIFRQQYNSIQIQDTNQTIAIARIDWIVLPPILSEGRSPCPNPFSVQWMLATLVLRPVQVPCIYVVETEEMHYSQEETLRTARDRMR